MAILLNPESDSSECTKTHYIRKKVESIFSAQDITLTKGSLKYFLKLFQGVPVAETKSILPFFDVPNDLFKALPYDTPLNIKINIIGEWLGDTMNNRGLYVQFLGSTGNTMWVNRLPEQPAADVITLMNCFSINNGGFLSTTGSQMVIQTFGNDFKIKSIVFIAEQWIPDV